MITDAPSPYASTGLETMVVGDEPPQRIDGSSKTQADVLVGRRPGELRHALPPPQAPAGE